MKKSKPIILLFALKGLVANAKITFAARLCILLCMGIFLFPITAHAQSDMTPPEITAKLNGEILHVEASDADSGVEAVFIGGNRVNYRVDSSLDLVFQDYGGTDEHTQVYAMDFAGNKSKTVQIKNPYYTTQSSNLSTEQREQNPFTPDGTGTVQDIATDGDGKEFFTIVTPDENVFYLIIDRQRDSENVYLLNTVTEEDLAALADKSGSGQSGSVTPTPTPTPQPESTPEPEPEPEPQPKTNTGTIMFILIAVAAAGGAGYYFKIVKPKQQSGELDEFDDDDDFYNDYPEESDDEDDDYYFSEDEEFSANPISEEEE